MLISVAFARVSVARSVSKRVKIKKAYDHFCVYSSKCLFLLLIIVIIVGLWPFNFFPINLATIDSTGGVNLEPPATVYTSVPSDKLRNLSAFTIAIRLATDSSGLSGYENILGYAATTEDANFILGQWKDGLGLHLRADGRSQEIHFGEYGVLRKGEQTYCLVSYNGENLTFYENGKIRKKWRMGSLKFSEWVNSYPLVIGTDANGRSQWRGTIYEMAIYDRGLSEREIADWSWKGGVGNRLKPRTKIYKAPMETAGSRIQEPGYKKEEPQTTRGNEQNPKDGIAMHPKGARNEGMRQDDRPLIHYVFDEVNTNEITFRGQKAIGVRDLGKGAAADLVITQYFTPYKRAFLDRPSKNWNDYHLNIIEDMLVNLFGFVPLGILIFTIFERKYMGMGVCLSLAVAAGFGVSLTIEVLQAFLPSRNSSMLDLMMNTTGTLIGGCVMAVVGKRLQGKGCGQQD